MDPKHLLRRSLLLAVLAATAVGQDWTDDQLIAATKGFQDEALAVRLKQVGALLGNRKEMLSPMVARIHGDHREYLLKIERLLTELTDERWQVRENAERTLIEIGGRARALIEQHKEKYDVLEQGIRCARIAKALEDKNPEQELRELKLLRGLVATSLYLDPEERLLRALRSALGHTDPTIVESTIRALGKLGGDEEAQAVQQLIAWKGGVHRAACLAALARMNGDKALAACRQAFADAAVTTTERMTMLRALHARSDAGAKALLKELEGNANPLVAAAARVHVATAPAAPGATTAPANPPKAKFTLPDRSQVEGGFGGFRGDSTFAVGSFEGLPVAELSFGDCDTIDFADRTAKPTEAARVFLNQGSLVAGELLAIGPETVTLQSASFGRLELPRKEVQGIAVDPALDRLVGASADHDRVRLRDNQFVDGVLAAATPEAVVIKLADGTQRELKKAEIAGLLFQRPRAQDVDSTIYQRLELVDGQRLIGFVVDASDREFAVLVPSVGASVVPIDSIAHVELGVGGGALWGFTLICDYSENRVLEVDDQGREVFVMNDVYGAWDAECLDNGNLLITEFAVSRVQEVDRKGNVVWVFEDLKNPYDADRLPNGNTLIADTFGSRVIEVNKKGEIVWKYDKDIRPFDADRLPNGNTLICNVLKDEVIEVSPAGEIVWRAGNLPNVYDADRLPNGNTLVTVRQKGLVQELDREGNVVWELKGLSSPSDADRLPNGHTLVSENGCVREFDRRGNVVWKKEVTWAVEANRY